MSLATEFAPVVAIPERARRAAPPQRLASVTALHRPTAGTALAPLRLTRRGRMVLTTAAAAVAVAMVVVAWRSAPGGAAGSPRPVAPATVTVGSGDSLWSIAVRVAPQRDPRAEVAELQRVNHLPDAALVPGEVLRTH